jgi:hypothetical protein
MSMLLLLAAAAGPVHGAPPRRAIPEAVLVELDRLEGRFEEALALDCDEGRCFSTGCVYVDHAVVDRPRKSALPGLFPDEGPGAVESQAWLTKAQCGFAHEPAISAADVSILSKRLQGRVATGWTSVAVRATALEPLPAYFRDAPEAEEAEGEAEEAAEPVPAVPPTAGEELWAALLPHAWWMVGIGLLTFAGGVLVWSLRRLGVETLEEKLLLAELEAGAGAAAAPVEADGEGDEDDEEAARFVAGEQARWEARLARVDEGHEDLALQALVRDRLRAGDLPLLAKAVLTFPDRFPAAFPAGGDVAPAKLALSEYLQDVDEQGLPGDLEFYRALHRHAVAAALTVQADAEVVRSLRDDFGAAGLAERMRGLHPRLGALIFTLAPRASQHELVRLLPAELRTAMAAWLLRSDRLDPAETARLFDVLRAPGGPDPADDDGLQVSDRGAALDAAPGAASLLLASLDAGARQGLLVQLLAHGEGSVPQWTRGIVLPSMLRALPQEARADLFLGVPVEGLAAWLSTLSAADAASVRDSLPEALRGSLQAASRGLGSERLALAEEGRRALAAALPEQLGRLGWRFEDLLRGGAPGSAA